MEVKETSSAFGRDSFDDEDANARTKIEMDEAMEAQDSDSYSNSTEGTSDEEDASDEKIAELERSLKENPYSYDLHEQLISLCRKIGDLEKLRMARETMSKHFPLTPELWLDWLTDEKRLATSAEEKEKLIQLFERAVKDYTSVSLWLEYVQFSIGNIGDSWTSSGIEAARQIFDKAVTAVGSHVTQGCLIYEAYKEFESLYLMYLQNKNASENDIKEQKDRIFRLYEKRLSVPLVDMEKIYHEYKELIEAENLNVSSIDYKYKTALRKLASLQEYEDDLFASEAPHYEEYKAYINYEKKENDPSRVINLYERAILENCLKDDLWLDYVSYMDKVVTKEVPTQALLAYERAIRNCPWCVQLWIKYGRALERYDQPHQKIKDNFETALTMGFTKEEDFKELWMAYLDFLRRKLSKGMTSGSAGDFQEIEDVFDRAISQMSQYFWGTESHYVLTKYWIFYTVKFKKELSTARQLWEDIIACNHKAEARFWLDYANFEKFYGDAAHYKQLLEKALKSVKDWPETFVDLLLTFEREEGNLETFEKSLEKCETAMKLINDKRAKEMRETSQGSKKESRRDSRSPKQQSSQKNAHKRDTKAESPVQMDSEGFKIPPTPGARLESPSKAAPENKKRNRDESDLPDPKRKKEETKENHGVSVKHDPSKDIRTVFLSNLDFKISDEKIREFCSPIGEIEEVRLVKDYKGRSKGFCYVVYRSELDARKALEKDREKIDGRPVLVSPCEDRKHSLPSNSKLKFSTGLEKNKVFVKNVPVSFTEKDLEGLFKEHGALKSIRVVTYRNGHSKGIAYVEYEDEISANKAVEKMDGFTVENKVLSVAISNPPPRRPRNEFIQERPSRYEASKTSSSAPSQNREPSFQPRASSSFGPRGRGRTQLSLVPRAVARSSMGNQKVSNSSLTNGQNSEPMDSSNGSAKPLSNSDFADMLKK